MHFSIAPYMVVTRGKRRITCRAESSGLSDRLLHSSWRALSDGAHSGQPPPPVAESPQTTIEVLPQATIEVSPRASIQVSTASYGLNCSNAAEGNATPYVKKACDGKRSCSFAVQDAASNISDPCPGVPKDFRVTYVCVDMENSAFVSPEAAGNTAFLICGGS